MKERNAKIVKAVVPRLVNRVIERKKIVISQENMKNRAEMKRQKKEEFVKKRNVKKKRNQEVKDILVSLLFSLKLLGTFKGRALTLKSS